VLRVKNYALNFQALLFVRLFICVMFMFGFIKLVEYVLLLK